MLIKDFRVNQVTWSQFIPKTRFVQVYCGDTNVQNTFFSLAGWVLGRVLHARWHDFQAMSMTPAITKYYYNIGA